ncbi:unnamed protein product [Amoebophrya sp. A120]|nr:unnamed protein product [Amoebophrya sp. A120]|eukprot:GSA120T00016189001.1
MAPDHMTTTASPAKPAEQLSADEWRLQRQLEYYFSDKNLWKDTWLREKLHGSEENDCTGWIDVAVIANFKRVQQITSDLDWVVRVLYRIDELEVRAPGSYDCTTVETTFSKNRQKVNNYVNMSPEQSGNKNNGTPEEEYDSVLSGTVSPTRITTKVTTTQYQVRRKAALPPKPVANSSSAADIKNGLMTSNTSDCGSTSGGAADRGPRNSLTKNNSGSTSSQHRDLAMDSDEEDRQQQSSTTTLDGPTQNKSSSTNNRLIPGFRQVPKTGVIYVMDEAAKVGYSAQTAHEWANLGQGSPETSLPKHWPASVRNRIKELIEAGKLPSCAAQTSNPAAHLHNNASHNFGPSEHIQGPWDQDLKQLEVTPENLHYGNVNGDLALRRAVAKFYNDMYRKGKQSLYQAENVALVGGGRLALTRLIAAMDQINLGHFLPDYTAYTELLSQFSLTGKINSIPILLNPENNFRLTLQELRREIVGKGLGALLFSNPCNPTGQLVEGEELKNWVRIARECQCSLVIDEIYSRYVYTQRMAPSDAHWRMVSAAQFVDDVNSDPVILLDGLTKNWRMPGLRVCWIVGPRQVIEAVGAAGSFLDGGPSLPTQRALVPLLNPKLVVEQTILLQLLFSHKRDFLLHRLNEMNIVVEHPPQGTFYCWCDISSLPAPLNTCWGFFRTMLNEGKVIVCPGVFFDVNPGHRRKFSNYSGFVRLSYGPSFPEIKRGLDAIEMVITKYRTGGSCSGVNKMGMGSSCTTLPSSSGMKRTLSIGEASEKTANGCCSEMN